MQYGFTLLSTFARYFLQKSTNPKALLWRNFETIVVMGRDLKTIRSNQAKNKQTTCTQYNKIKRTHYLSNVSSEKVV